jgi:hypothetical protein
MIDAAWIPIAILGLPFLGILFLSASFEGSTSAYRVADATDQRYPDVGLISQLSGHVSPGAIRSLSGPVSPGAISRLSAWRSPGAISKLSGHKSPGAISRLSSWKSPGAISRLSAPGPVGSIARLSDGFFVSKLIGLPLLTRSQGPLEPDSTLLTEGANGGRYGVVG